jgi:predicted nucleic acid-binding protein
LFDALVAAVAKKNNADAIFSFDEWYKKLGFTLVTGLI